MKPLRKSIYINTFVGCVLLLLGDKVFADNFQLLGIGVCRPAGISSGQQYSYRNKSWEECRSICESRDCQGIEYNLRPSHSICEHHYYPVKLKPTGRRDDVVHTCWVRTN